MTTIAAEPRDARLPLRGRAGLQRARLIALFDHFLTLNAKHVALCLGIDERIAGVMLAQLTAAGKLRRVEYILRREDRARVAYQKVNR